MPRVGLDRGQDARGLARLLDALDRVFDGRPRFGMRKVSQMAEVRGEVARTDEQAVHAFHGGDGLEVLQGQPGFDLNQHAEFLVDALVVISDSPVIIRPCRSDEATPALRWISGGGDGGARFFGRLHVRHEQVLHADVEQSLEEDQVIPGWPHDGGGGAAGHRLQIIEDHRQLIGGVFGVDQNPIEAGAGDHFHGQIAAEAIPEADLRPAITDRLLEGVNGHSGVHRSFQLVWPDYAGKEFKRPA